MSAFIAVAGMTAIVDSSTVSPPGTVVCVIVNDPPTGTKVKASTALVYRDGDTSKVSAITVPGAGATIPDPGPYTATWQSTAIKAKAEGKEVLLEGDKTTVINAVPQIPGTPPTNYPVSFQLVVQASGQVKAKAQ